MLLQTAVFRVNDERWVVKRTFTFDNTTYHSPLTTHVLLIINNS